jgi:hypothetical protein
MEGLNWYMYFFGIDADGLEEDAQGKIVPRGWARGGGGIIRKSIIAIIGGL